MTMFRTCLVSLVAALVLVSCGGSGGFEPRPPASEDNESTTTPPQTAPEPTPTPTPTPEEPAPAPQPAPTPQPEPGPEEPSPEPQPEPAPPVAQCPANYEMVAANETLKTAAFCIAKYEMKKVDNKASSVPNQKPWLANKATAQAACAALGAGYRLPSNSEWNAAALEIYHKEDNWLDKGKNTLYTGFYSGWTEPIEIKNTNDPYDGTGKKAGNERRTFVLASGAVIWDFGGNAWEWVSDTIYGSSYTPDLSSPYGRRYHNNNWDAKPGSKALFDFTGLSDAGKKDTYMGNLFGGSSGKVIRGGAVCIHSPGTTGIFAANIGDITADELQAPASWNLRMNNIGFRCVKGL